MPNLREMQDSYLLKKISEGSVRAFEEIFRRYYPVVLNFLNSLLKEMAVAEDQAQELFVKLWLKRDTLPEIKSLKDYLFISSRNAALSALRNRRAPVQELTSLMGEKLDADGLPSDVVEFRSARSAVRDVIKQMPPVRGEVFRMSRELDMSNGQIADELGISVRTVEKHISLALRDIRAKMS